MQGFSPRLGPELDQGVPKDCLTWDEATFYEDCLEANEVDPFSEAASLSTRASQEISGAAEVTAKKMSDKAVFLILALCVLMPPLTLIFGAFVIYWINRKEESRERVVDIVEKVHDVQKEEFWTEARWLDYFGPKKEFLFDGETIKKDPFCRIEGNTKEAGEQLIQAIQEKFPDLSKETILDLLVFAKPETFATLNELIMPSSSEGAFLPIVYRDEQARDPKYSTLEILQTREGEWQVRASMVFGANPNLVQLKLGKNFVKGTLIINPLIYETKEGTLERTYKGRVIVEEITLDDESIANPFDLLQV